ncbi:hypothetical protein SMIM3I_00798 [Streptococcus mitis]|uniref:Uncharacterized protein n=1 Tax=Streptococcus mitis TaxID=28037 RepID=A0A150NQP1_STRMT|nr:hypothetical protein SMIM3I_00798 [Streptococcus mitis]
MIFLIVFSKICRRIKKLNVVLKEKHLLPFKLKEVKKVPLKGTSSIYN